MPAFLDTTKQQMIANAVMPYVEQETEVKLVSKPFCLAYHIHQSQRISDEALLRYSEARPLLKAALTQIPSLKQRLTFAHIKDLSLASLQFATAIIADPELARLISSHTLLEIARKYTQLAPHILQHEKNFRPNTLNEQVMGVLNAQCDALEDTPINNTPTTHKKRACCPIL